MTWNELKTKVEQHENVLTVSTAELRDVYGVKRMGIHVAGEIQAKLAGVGLGVTPEIEADSWQQVRLFKLGTPVGDILTAADNPGEEGDKKLRELAEGDAGERLRRIKALVCD
ncbi:MAG: hypothetical protein QOH76_3511 [Thermoleophilaceae bacterium]|nr:hypothetical protein [Thermoleophilaceae bacterium]